MGFVPRVDFQLRTRKGRFLLRLSAKTPETVSCPYLTVAEIDLDLRASKSTYKSIKPTRSRDPLVDLRLVRDAPAASLF